MLYGVRWWTGKWSNRRIYSRFSKTIAQEGQVWYNTTSTVLKSFGKQGTLSWSSGSALNTGRIQLGGAGSGNTSAVVFGGRTSDPTTTDVSETYDGTTWTEGNNLLQARYTGAGFGTATAALYVTGFGFSTHCYCVY